MQTIKLFLIALTLLFTTILFSNASYAQNIYQRCSENQSSRWLDISAIQDRNKIKNSEEYTTPTFHDCLILDHQQAIIATVHPSQDQSSDNAGNYDLSLFLIDRQKNHIIEYYQHPEIIRPQTRLENIKFDINSYSNIQNQYVIGLAVHDVHIGGISSSTRTLQLFKIQPQHTIKWVLRDLITDQSASSAPYQCDDPQSSDLSRKLIVLEQKTYTMSDIQINENLESTQVNANNCAINISKKRQSHIIKFDGEQYHLKQLKLLDINI